MNTAQVLLVADTWGTQGGWWIAMCVVMMVCMAAMMFGMARMRTASEHRRPAPWERSRFSRRRSSGWSGGSCDGPSRL